MLRVILTSDYEIHGNGDGDPTELMIEPTNRMLEIFDLYGARLTVMADVAEIIRFREHYEETGRDDCNVEGIVDQLRRAVSTGHDVQLHVHPSYFRAEKVKGSWKQDYSSYDLTRLGYSRLVEIVSQGKATLEAMLKPVSAAYECFVFRAANWSMQPSQDIVKALIDCGIRIDTSVFRYGRRDGIVSFDYTDAWSDLYPWPASSANICTRDLRSPLLEVPIYAERRWIGAFFSAARFRRAISGRAHRLETHSSSEGSGDPSGTGVGWVGAARWLLGRHAWKLDFNQCTAGQLIKGLQRAERKARRVPCDLPLVLIGHSKSFSRGDKRRLEPFLEYVASGTDRFVFDTFAGVDEGAIRRALHTQ